MNLHFFKSDNNQLLGAYHPARSNALSRKVVVICPPIGQEYIRSHWCLRLLAGQLARRGIHVLRFDYSGIGDSSGDVDQIQSVAEWECDIQNAVRHAQDLAPSDSVMLLGLRMGSTLATNFAIKSPHVNSLLMWEPVHRGQRYLSDQRQLHRELLEFRTSRMTTETSDFAEEILGTRYPKTVLNDIEDIRIDWEAIEQPHFVVDLKPNAAHYHSLSNPMRKIVIADDECSWNDLNQLETAWLRPVTTRLIVDQVVDTFARLEKFGVLRSEATV